MPAVCFTGKGTENGRLIARDEWIQRAEAVGWVFHKQVTAFTDYLVASRHDTEKARRATALGAKTVTYEEFMELIGNAVVVGTWPAQAPAAPIPIDTSGMEELEGWGSF